MDLRRKKQKNWTDNDLRIVLQRPKVQDEKLFLNVGNHHDPNKNDDFVKTKYHKKGNFVLKLDVILEDVEYEVD